MKVVGQRARHGIAQQHNQAAVGQAASQPLGNGRVKQVIGRCLAAQLPGLGIGKVRGVPAQRLLTVQREVVQLFDGGQHHGRVLRQGFMQ